MGDKPQVSAKNTYVLDADEVERLDELSLTSIIGDAAHFAQGPRDQPGDAPVVDEATSLGDTTINELLGDPTTAGEQRVDRKSSNHGVPEQVEPADDLIAPELLFPGRASDD